MLTERQQQVLDYIREMVDARGYPPSVREIGEAVGLSSPSTVHSHLNSLVEAGAINTRLDERGAQTLAFVTTIVAAMVILLLVRFGLRRIMRVVIEEQFDRA